MDVVPGQLWQRVLAVLLTATWTVLYLEQAVLGVPGLVLLLVGIVALMLSILAIPPVYAKWMAFAVWLSVWSTRVIFTVVFLVVVPFTWLFYVLSRRSRRQAGPDDSLWIEKKTHDRSVDELERMG